MTIISITYDRRRAHKSNLLEWISHLVAIQKWQKQTAWVARAGAEYFLGIVAISLYPFFMKLLLILALFHFPFQALAAGEMLHILPDAPSTEYEAELQKIGAFHSVLGDGLDSIFVYGRRNIDWINYLNSFRPEREKLSFTSKETQRRIPIDQPWEYNVGIIVNDLSQLKAQMPKEMVEILFEGKQFPSELPVAEEQYLNFGRLLDRIYQAAARWRANQPWLDMLKVRRSNDVRGFYFLSRMTDRKVKLANYHSLPEEEKIKIADWLVAMCLNGGTGLMTCKNEVNKEVRSKRDLEIYYQAKVQASQRLWSKFFQIDKTFARKDILWRGNSLVSPFWDPLTEDIRAFVKGNLEDEWRLDNLSLAIDFVNPGSGNHPRIKFQPDITPHVNGLGGNTIFMNSKQPITEYDANWIVRHEFGHVLGFPDCYVEFYLVERQTIMNYQIDSDNIMCSRRGAVRALHFEELKKAYR